MLAVLLILVTLQNLVEAQNNIISVPNGDTKGNWGVMEVCDEGTVVRAFQLKVQQSKGPFIDDTALNGIALLCAKDSSREAVRIIRSSVGEFGSWGPAYWCDSKTFLMNFSLRVESTNIIDKTAANNIKFTCSDGSVMEGDGRSQGTYGPWSTNCEIGIRGIQTRVQKKQGFVKDDVALTDARFVCNDY
ncbi:vitelline membrane outer layer protein 1 homolog [Eleutherodactylus coqui]|uniref:vitelline membrane outer layer protein 1 homolog n=1 Tax=Eleutherodactylus coqui TaxID=57060 RepID=UPI0034629D1A